MNPRAVLFLLAFAAAAAGNVAAASKDAQDAAPQSVPCVEVRIGADRAGRLDCLNQALRAAADAARPGSADVAVATNRPPTALGLPTPAEAKQRLGNAYGHSVVPQRPSLVYAPILPPAH